MPTHISKDILVLYLSPAFLSNFLTNLCITTSLANIFKIMDSVQTTPK